MTRYVALLRGVNLGGHKTVAMADLCRLLTHAGCLDGRSLLQSGNLVFASSVKDPAELEHVFEKEAKSKLSLSTEFFVRTADEWKAIITGNPFRDEAAHDPGHLVVLCLKAAPAPKQVDALREAISGRETVRVKGRHAYVVYPDGIGHSRLTASVIDRALGTRCTGRNWNTVKKIGALVAQ